MDDPNITDPLLLTTLAAAQKLRTQTLSLLSFLTQNASPTPTTESQLALSRHTKALTTHLAKIRGLHRRIVHDQRSTRNSTLLSKSEIDVLHLDLQNLFYEQRHLSSEIAACEGYKHSHRSLPLVSEAEFLETHPECIGQSEREVMVARIGDELVRRQGLEEQRLVLLKRKQALVAENRRRREELDVLDREVEKFVAGAAGVGKIFEGREGKEVAA